MVVRFVRLRVKPGTVWELRSFYESRILSALQQAGGCLFAGLLEPADAARDEWISMTVWSGEAEAGAYESSGLYDRLLDESDPYLADATEWSADLGGPRVGDRPPLPDPEVEAFPVEVARVEPPAVPRSGGHLYLRIVELRVEPTRFDDLRRRYREAVLPGLMETPGCSAVFLLEGPLGSHALSVSLWDSEEDAIRYEGGGRFEELIAHLREYLSGLYLWKLSAVSAGGRRQVEGRDLDVRGYQILAGRQLRG